MLTQQSRGVFLGMIALGMIAPPIAFVVVGVAFAGQVALTLLHILACATLPGSKTAAPRSADMTPLRFSVHIPTHEEPSEVVMRTVEALSRQVDAPPFEVIVLDNNTSDPALWRPVDALCRTLGTPFCFFHEEGVRGAKAGALNIALSRTDPRTTHVVTVDADYVVSPDFLATAAQELNEQDDDFLQFPQAYSNDAGRAAGVSLELADYFQRHARQADGADAMLLTGTLSVIRRTALVAAGGWSGETLTEDAELGLRLRRLGYQGRLVDKVVGYGLLPLDLHGLEQQRYRWAAGNVATILTGQAGLPLRTRMHVASQLTAWANFAVPLAGGLVGGALALALGSQAAWLELMVALSGYGLMLVFLSAGFPLMLVAAIRQRRSLQTVLSALGTRITLILPSATGTVDALLGRCGRFRRTSKDANEASGAVDPALLVLALVGLALLGLPALPVPARLAALLFLLPYPLALLTQARLGAYRMSLQTQ